MDWVGNRALRKTALLSALILAAAGCLTSSDGGGDGGEKTAIDILFPVGVDEAYFILQPGDTRREDWPEAFSQYSFFVCNASMNAEDIAQVRADIPGAICVAYTSAQDVPIETYPGNPYFDALTAAFSASFCIRDLNTGEIVRIYGHGTPRAVPSWIVRQASIDALVAFHEAVTMEVPWDGFYVDQCTKTYPNHRNLTLLEITDRFDVNDDGVEDTVEFLSQRYEYGRPILTRALRDAFPDKIIVANSGGRLDDPMLNGLTLEGVGDRFTLDEARTFLTAQRAVARQPYHAVCWSTTEESDRGALELAEELGVYYGFVTDLPEGRALRLPTLQRWDPDR
jgi:hypothetical protein